MTDPLDELAALIGRRGAQALACVVGGRECYIPKAPVADSWLVILLGEIQAQRLAERYGGKVLRVPMPPIAAAKAALVRELHAQGRTVHEITGRVNISRRSVFRILAGVPRVTARPRAKVA